MSSMENSQIAAIVLISSELKSAVAGEVKGLRKYVSFLNFSFLAGRHIDFQKR